MWSPAPAVRVEVNWAEVVTRAVAAKAEAAKAEAVTAAESGADSV